jgi:hypothetical protein
MQVFFSFLQAFQSHLETNYGQILKTTSQTDDGKWISKKNFFFMKCRNHINTTIYVQALNVTFSN